MSSIPRFRHTNMHMGDWITPGIRNLVLACTGVFVVQEMLNLFAARLGAEATLLFGLSPYNFVHGPWIWQPVTYIFLHDPRSLWHLLFNMLFLWMFGVDLERAWGKHRFYVYFFITGIGAGLINVLINMAAAPHGTGNVLGIQFDSRIPTIGASGAIYGILLASAVMFPDRRIWLIPFPVQIPMKVYVIGAGAIEFFSTLGTGGDNVSHVTHLGGMLIGYLYLRRGSWFFRARNGMSDWKRKRARRKFEVYMRKHRDEPPSGPDQWVN